MIYQVSLEEGISDFFFTGILSNHSNSPHVHSHIEFDYVLNGTLSHTVDDLECTLSSNSMRIVMPYQIHHFAPTPQANMFVIACPPEYIAEYRTLFQDKEFSPSAIPFCSTVRKIIEDIIVSNVRDPFRLKSLIYYTLSEYQTSCELLPRKSLEYDVYRKAIVYLSEHYSEPLSLSQVALHAGVSAAHLSRVINSRGGSSFTDLVNSIRIFEAKRLLEQTSLPVSEIAFRVGYGSIRNFNRIFQKYFDCQPRNLQKNSDLPPTIVSDNS